MTIPPLPAPGMSLSLAGRTAVVTGAASGIGRATAQMAADRGARVVAVDRNAEALAAIVADLRERGSDAFGIEADLADPDSFPVVLGRLRDEAGSVDVLASCAGITRWLSLQETSVDDWNAINDVNARAVFFLMKGVSAMMVEAGRGGSIINVSSIAGKGFKNTSAAAYASSKAAVVAMSRVASGYLAPHRVRVNCICPGPTKTGFLMEGLELFTERTGRSLEEELDAWVSQVPLGFGAEPEDMAEAICFLASDAARFVTGQAWNIDGGMVFD